ncbi:MAG: pilus assembly protein [Rhodospirillales bacterium]|nr:pilus assembly protein [Rhodospirillales bacterium]MCB9965434.1 pilus assembly protein [Rhodospirillales bacterium]MCB9973923.1 pilus assembly protein [Rhodospirillales bacterium]MCB9979861.1 pilus assembly protein [Rhodospirillales bacterium]
MKKIIKTIEYWVKDQVGVAAVEAALIFPVLLIMFIGLFDLGSGILASQKTIRASQVVVDLVTRSRVVNSGDIDEAINAGSLAYLPMSSENFGVDIVSIRFDEDSVPEIVWRETRNMTPQDDVFDAIESLAEPGGGVVMVSAKYKFEPLFAGFVVDEIDMNERAFGRGRRGAVVERE